MKHLVLTQFGTPSESVALHDDRDPVPGPGDVLVCMEAAAVNPSDLLLLRGVYLARPEPPAPVGGEGVGIVVDAGAQADQGLLGKRVIVLPTYTYGTWAEKVVVPHSQQSWIASRLFENRCGTNLMQSCACRDKEPPNRAGGTGLRRVVGTANRTRSRLALTTNRCRTHTHRRRTARSTESLYAVQSGTPN